MQLEFHPLERRYEFLRVRNPQRQQQLLASLAATGQQIPIMVVAVAEQPDRYLVIDGYVSAYVVVLHQNEAFGVVIIGTELYVAHWTATSSPRRSPPVQRKQGNNLHVIRLFCLPILSWASFGINDIPIGMRYALASFHRTFRQT
jgi:hypothetical protein